MFKRVLAGIRRNHALEHATINLLSRRHPGAHIVGASGPSGFTLYSNLKADDIIRATREALTALRSGHAALAVHENCGTNLVISASLTMAATILGLGYLPAFSRPTSRAARRGRDFLERMPQAILLNALALVLANPLARWVQAYVTTDADIGDLEIASVFTDYQGSLRRVRVHTRAARSASSSGACRERVSIAT